MPYLSRFDADLFVSYGHLDNSAAAKDELPWIERFHKDLERRVSQYLGGNVSIWRDNKLQGNHSFADEIESQVGRAAAIVPIVSPRYLTSDWCQRELKAFLRAVERSGGLKVGTRTRLFKVIKTLVEVEKQPEIMQQVLGYEFYRLENGRPRELPDRDPEPDAEKRYLARLDDVAYDLHLLLKEMKAREQDAPNPEPPSDAKCVYLADTTSDLGEVRDQIRREMLARGYRVLPDQPLSQVAAELKQQVACWLRGCCLSLHLAGSRYGLIPEGDGETRSIIWLQQELAAERQSEGGFHSVVWMPPGTEPGDPRQNDFLDALQDQLRIENRFDLLKTPVEELKNFIFDKLTARPERAPAAEAHLGRIYLICEQRDLEAVGSLRDWLQERGMGVDLPLWEGAQEDIREDHEATLQDCDGVLIYYGSANEKWLREKIRELRRAKGLGRSKPFKPQCIYLGPQETDAKKVYSNPEFVLIRNFGPFSAGRMEPFLAVIAKPQGAAV
jgi:hypothetical protein